MLYIIRGLPGSGKNTLGENLADWNDSRLDHEVFAADDYFVDDDGVYRFDPSKLPEAHAQCQENVKRALRSHWAAVVVVANTFTQRWEMEPYLAMSDEVTVIDLFDAGLTDEALAARNTHGVPVEAIRAMRARYEHSWKDGDPRPPWER